MKKWIKKIENECNEINNDMRSHITYRQGINLIVEIKKLEALREAAKEVNWEQVIFKWLIYRTDGIIANYLNEDELRYYAKELVLKLEQTLMAKRKEATK